ncbi:MAG: hypothetical protein P1T08_16805 [Acidimicrobiia bacterium]|nr:hypothetical protein [Acidimicrobiia bacterium]
MNDSDLCRLMLPDDGLPPERHDLIKERVMTAVRTEQPFPGSQSTSSSRVRVRLVPTLASVIAVLLVAGTAGAMGLFPWQAKETLDYMDCRTSGSVETLVATADASDGNTTQLWTTSPGPDAAPSGFAMVEIDSQGEYVGGVNACNTATWEFAPMGEIWVGAPAEASAQETVLTVLGHVPTAAATVEVTFDDGSVVQTNVQTDGYFLELVHGPGVDVSPGNPEPHFPEAIIVTALDTDGNVIARQDLRDLG